MATIPEIEYNLKNKIETGNSELLIKLLNSEEIQTKYNEDEEKSYQNFTLFVLMISLASGNKKLVEYILNNRTIPKKLNYHILERALIYGWYDIFFKLFNGKNLEYYYQLSTIPKTHVWYKSAHKQNIDKEGLKRITEELKLLFIREDSLKLVLEHWTIDGKKLPQFPGNGPFKGIAHKKS